jgi:hypothetical protein
MRILLCLALLLFPAAAQRLRVSDNGRYLQTAEGKPFLYVGDTAWQLLHRLNREETAYYLDNRRAKGFTVIQTVALAELAGIDTPNAYGHLPLMDRDPGRPNEAYFQHVDWVLDEMARRGLVAGLLPTWGSHWKQGPDRKPVFNVTNARSFGRFLAARTKGKPVIWILGGDNNIDTPAERAVIDAMAAGLREGDGGEHLITFHPRGPGMASSQLRDAPWLDFYMNQSSHGARDHDTGLYIERDYALSPPKPTLDGEPRYEGITIGFYFAGADNKVRFDDDDTRQAAWWAMLAGACGHTYGHGSVWQMWQADRKTVLGAATPWREALDHPGAFQMGHLRRFFEARPFHVLEPAQSMLLDGPRTGGAKVRAALARDRSFAVVYSPQGAPFTLAQDRVRGQRWREVWFDPRYGIAYPVHTSTAVAVQTYTPPTSGRGQDWVLVLEDAGAGLPKLPGEY